MEVGLDGFPENKTQNIEFVREKLETRVLDITSRIDLEKSINLALDNPSGFKNLDGLATDLNLVNNIRLQINNGKLEHSPEESIRDSEERISKIYGDFTDNELLVGDLSLSEKKFSKQDGTSNQNELDSIYSELNDQIRPALEEFRHLANIYRPEQDEKSMQHFYSVIRDLVVFSSNHIAKPSADFVNFVKNRIVLEKYKLEIEGIIPETDQTKFLKAKERKSVDRENLMKSVELGSEFNISILPISTAQLINEVTEPIPYDLLKNLTTIFLKIKKDGDPGGEHEPNIWRGSLMNATIRLYFDTEILKHAGRHKKAITEQAIKHGWHELGHAAHNTMNIEEMKNWEDVMQNDFSNITEYVDIVDKNKEFDRRKREDFSESFAMFIANPAYLNVISPERYRFMKDLFTSRSSEEELEKMNERTVYLIEKQTELWKEKGLTESQIKEEFDEGKRTFNYTYHPSEAMIN